MRLFAKGGDADMDALATLVGMMLNVLLTESQNWV